MDDPPECTLQNPSIDPLDHHLDTLEHALTRTSPPPSESTKSVVAVTSSFYEENSFPTLENSNPFHNSIKILTHWIMGSDLDRSETSLRVLSSRILLARNMFPPMLFFLLLIHNNSEFLFSLCVESANFFFAFFYFDSNFLHR